MSIGRIKEIKNIGTFANFSNGASLGFEKLTFIYGFNTFGKTTLADIFQSLKDNDSDIIQSRKTIPQQNQQQKVIFTEKNITESDIRFEQNSWSNNSIRINLEIFGTDFIHRNLFTGLTIGRENRENFTQFVLGERGVMLAKKIAEKRKSFGDNKRDLKLKVPQFVKNKSEEDIKKFIEFSIDISKKEEIITLLLQKQTDLQKQKGLLKEPAKILSMEEPNVLSEPSTNHAGIINEINSLLQKGYTDIKDEFLDKLKYHIGSNFSDTDNAEVWIKAGIDYCKNEKDGNCPFCGQSLKKASDLMDIYNSYFDNAYNNFISSIERDLSVKVSELEHINFRYKVQLQESLVKINEFKNLITDDIFLKLLSSLENKLSSLKEDELNQRKENVLLEIRSKKEIKNKTPHKKVNIIEPEEFLNLLSVYIQLIKDIKQIIDDIRKYIIEFKKPYKNTEEIQKKIHEISRKIDELEYKKARIELDEECQAFVKAQSEIKMLEKNIISLQEKLKEDQSNYLDNYFTKINDLFKALGSKNFTLERDTDNTGHMPVYSLKVKFHGVEIPNNRLRAVFSESDRRALSLAIFWARVCLKTDQEKAELVVILDDPVTSFDDNRVTKTINLFKEILNTISQMVILTHYPHFIKRFCEITKEAHITTKYLKIEQNLDSSFLTKCSREEFTQSDYDKAFLKIYGFINREHQNSIKTDLRPFIENFYLPTVFAKQIRDRNVDCSDLESMIDGIFDDDEIKNKLHNFRTTLNPDHHSTTLNNDEDVRGLASEIVDYLYSISIVEQN